MTSLLESILPSVSAGTIFSALGSPLIAIPNTFFFQFNSWYLTLFQFLVVFVIVTLVYLRIQGTYIAQLLKGVVLVLALHVLTAIFGLTILSGILQVVLQISVIGFIILFQPELRRLLVYLGQPDLLSRNSFAAGGKQQRTEFMVHDLVESIRLLSKTKTGALIVLEMGTGIGGNYLEAGTRLDARLSTELLLTIFHTNTPLHDGAVIISPDNMILAAGVLLPLSENPNLSWKYGTRHRAAIGLSEISDSRCLVVSEETGSVSLVYAGNIEKVPSIEELKQQLETLFGVTSEPQNGTRRSALSEILNTDVFQKFFSKNSHESMPMAGAGIKEERNK